MSDICDFSLCGSWRCATFPCVAYTPKFHVSPCTFGTHSEDNSKTCLPFCCLYIKDDHVSSRTMRNNGSSFSAAFPICCVKYRNLERRPADGNYDPTCLLDMKTPVFCVKCDAGESSHLCTPCVGAHCTDFCSSRDECCNNAICVSPLGCRTYTNDEKSTYKIGETFCTPLFGYRTVSKQVAMADGDKKQKAEILLCTPLGCLQHKDNPHKPLGDDFNNILMTPLYIVKTDQDSGFCAFPACLSCKKVSRDFHCCVFCAIPMDWGNKTDNLTTPPVQHMM